MRRLIPLFLLIVAASALAAHQARTWRTRARIARADQALDSMSVPQEHPAPSIRDEDDVLSSSAARAWAFVATHYESTTGMVRTVPEYPVATIWDVGSMLAAFFCARQLGIIDESDYDTRMGRLLATLARIPLFENTTFNKTYDTRSGAILNQDHSPSEGGFGWSVTDLGRLLVWLRIIFEHDPGHQQAVQQIVRRIDMARVVRDGYLWGEELDESGHVRSFPEGSLGYEQYGALGFALWGHRADRALSLTANAVPLLLGNDMVLVDRRPHSCLTSEPFVLAGLEIGWSTDMARLAKAILNAQAARYRRTGRVTIVSEDASAVAPYHFYYYCVNGDGGPFSIAAHGGIPVQDGPRTVSAKAAFGWYALARSDYTTTALQYVVERWGVDSLLVAGIDEATGEAVGPPNINTAAVILEAALYVRRDRPFLGGQGVEAVRH